MKVFGLMGKGGVGKTTLSVALTSVLNKYGRAICIGIDQQHNHTTIIKDLKLNIPYLEIKNSMTDLVNTILLNLGFGEFKDLTPIVAHDFVAMITLAEQLYKIKDNYDYVIIDMPPNTAMLDMLAVPKALDNTIIKVLTLKKRINRLVKGSDVTIDGMEYMEVLADNLKKKFNDCNFMLIGIPTRLGLLEVEKGINALYRNNMKPVSIICNMVQPVPEVECPHCMSKYYSHNEWLTKFEELSKKHKLPISLVEYSEEFDTYKRVLEDEILDIIGIN